MTGTTFGCVEKISAAANLPAAGSSRFNDGDDVGSHGKKLLLPPICRRRDISGLLMI